MARKAIVGGNWKSNPATAAEVKTLVTAFNDYEHDSSKLDVVIAPTFVHAPVAKDGFRSGINAALQNCSKEGEGAFTGEVTASQVKDAGYNWVVLGHSERRHKYGESNADVAAKLKKTQDAKLNTIWCIGELLEEREAGKIEEVLKSQIESGVGSVSDWSLVVIAYEPVWAIGTGVVASEEQAQEAHALCRKIISAAVSADVANSVRIQYGGSVSPANCGGLIKCADIDGFLVGGASLKPTFVDIIKTVEAAQ